MTDPRPCPECGNLTTRALCRSCTSRKGYAVRRLRHEWEMGLLPPTTSYTIFLPYTTDFSKNSATTRDRAGNPRLTKRAKMWLKRITDEFAVEWLNQGRPELPEPHFLEFLIHRPIKPGHKADPANLIDYGQDAVAKGLQLDDATFITTARAEDVEGPGAIIITFSAGES